MCSCGWGKSSEDGSQGEILLMNEVFLYCWSHGAADKSEGGSEVLVLI